MITIQNLSKTYTVNNNSVQALKDINLSIEPGEIFGIIGTSGAGKTTLLRTLNGLEKPCVGMIRINQINLNEMKGSGLRTARKSMGMIFQHFNLLKTQTVLENILLPIKLSGLKVEDHRDWIRELLAITNLESKTKMYPAHLSGGEKQRVSIARALINKPSVLLCDEATSALDPLTTRDILNLLANINKIYKITIVLITHEMQVIKKICDRVALLHQGEIVEVSHVKQFLSSPVSIMGKKFIQDYDLNLKNFEDGAAC